MSKMFVAVLAGVFVGAFLMEMANRKRPGLVVGLEDDVEDKLDEFRRAFAEGYAGGAAEAAS